MEAAEKVGGFDIYILDILMPGMDGIELGVKLREQGYDGSIIYLTNSSVVESILLRVPFAEAIAPLLEDTRFSHCSKKICRDLRTEWSAYWQTEEM